jgi:AraC-like DNA-binding protein
MVSRPGAGPREVRLRCAADGQAPRLEQFFGCPVRFGADVDAMAFANDLLDAPLAGEDPEIARDHDQAAERYLDTIDVGGTAAEVRRVLVGLLPSGEVGLDRVAARLGRGQSTLQRRLQQEGVSYRGVLEATRRQLAERYLADPGLSLGEIAFLVGFTDQSSFSRSFRRWTGKSPRAWRQAAPRDPG